MRRRRTAKSAADLKLDAVVLKSPLEHLHEQEPYRNFEFAGLKLHSGGLKPRTDCAEVYRCRLGTESSQHDVKKRLLLLWHRRSRRSSGATCGTCIGDAQVSRSRISAIMNATDTSAQALPGAACAVFAVAAAAAGARTGTPSGWLGCAAVGCWHAWVR